MGKDYDNQDMVICRPTGEPIDVKNVNKRLDKLIENLEMKRIRFHDLRHTHATLMLSIGTPVKIVSERLGPCESRINFKHVCSLLPSMQVEAVKTFSESMQKFKNAHS
ncbi:integrase [Virgibacillus halotolerans]|nr:integrase [Virgibacillus halotolerans]